jgi:hypothetical protein
MNITGAKWAGGELILATSSPDAVRFAMAFEPGDYTISKERKKRSLDANGYAWVLIDKIAAAMRLGKEEVYRNSIRDIGGNSEIICVPDKAVDTLRRCWEKNGLGWQMDTMPSKLPGCTNAVLFYGSSAYDTHQMSILIDRLVQDCKALGIETLPPEKLAALTEGWDG